VQPNQTYMLDLIRIYLKIKSFGTTISLTSVTCVFVCVCVCVCVSVCVCICAPLTIQGEHKVFPSLQTFITRKLCGIQYFFNVTQIKNFLQHISTLQHVHLLYST
jgi:hypothetical protein